MFMFMLAILSLSCLFGAIELRKIGYSVANITIISSGIPIQTPQEFVEYGQRFVNISDILYVIGGIGLMYTVYCLFKKEK